MLVQLQYIITQISLCCAGLPVKLATPNRLLDIVAGASNIVVDAPVIVVDVNFVANVVVVVVVIIILTTIQRKAVADEEEEA